MNHHACKTRLGAVGMTASCLADGRHAHAGVGMCRARQVCRHAHGKRGHGTRAIVLMLGIALVSGCSSGEPSRLSAPQTETQVAPPLRPLPPAQKPPPPIEKKAEVGVGEKGRYDTTGVVSVVTVPVASLFAARERMAFDIQIPQALQLFKGLEGRPPKSHEEFIERIIKENHINLPKLPEGESYLYDPKAEQLMVLQPRP